MYSDYSGVGNSRKEPGGVAVGGSPSSKILQGRLRGNTLGPFGKSFPFIS